MNQRFMHHDMVTAWLNGERIQIKFSDGTWGDLPLCNSIQSLPAFSLTREYRVKPKEESDFYAIDSHGVVCGSYEAQEFEMHRAEAAAGRRAPIIACLRVNMFDGVVTSVVLSHYKTNLKKKG